MPCNCKERDCDHRGLCSRCRDCLHAMSPESSGLSEEDFRFWSDAGGDLALVVPDPRIRPYVEKIVGWAWANYANWAQIKGRSAAVGTAASEALKCLDEGDEAGCRAKLRTV